MVKNYKIIKTELFKKQEKKLPVRVKKELNKALKKLSQNPLGANTMRLGGNPTAKELKNWMSRIKPETIDLLFEYLHEKNCLTVKGRKLAQEFYDTHIKK